MRIGIIRDLAVGATQAAPTPGPGQDVLARGVSVGAPPDEFNQRGQDWTQPPWHPQRLAGPGYAPLAEADRLGPAACRGTAGGPRDGAAAAVVGARGNDPGSAAPTSGTTMRPWSGCWPARRPRPGALAIGEDLGTVDAVDPGATWPGRACSARRCSGSSAIRDGAPLPPGKWRRNCLATVGTHDVPPVAAFVTGEQVELRARLGLLARPYQAERRGRGAAVTAWRDALAGEGLLAAGQRPGPAEFTVALYGYLARTPAALLGVSLADAVGDRRPQNMPGTTTSTRTGACRCATARGAPSRSRTWPTRPRSGRWPGWWAARTDQLSAGTSRPTARSPGARPAAARAWSAVTVSLPGGRAPGSAAPAARRPGSR